MQFRPHIETLYHSRNIVSAPMSDFLCMTHPKKPEHYLAPNPVFFRSFTKGFLEEHISAFSTGDSLSKKIKKNMRKVPIIGDRFKPRGPDGKILTEEESWAVSDENADRQVVREKINRELWKQKAKEVKRIAGLYNDAIEPYNHVLHNPMSGMFGKDFTNML